MLVKEFRR